jgi:hypothetical protein
MLLQAEANQPGDQLKDDQQGRGQKYLRINLMLMA